jgi:hypothetical protein
LAVRFAPVLSGDAQRPAERSVPEGSLEISLLPPHSAWTLLTGCLARAAIQNSNGMDVNINPNSLTYRVTGGALRLHFTRLFSPALRSLLFCACQVCLISTFSLAVARLSRCATFQLPARKSLRFDVDAIIAISDFAWFFRLS